MIEAGEYVRTKSGEIGIFKKYAEEGVQQWFTMLQNGTLYTTATRAIVNHSKNIIDLIEVGDYVNGYRVLAIEDSIYKNSKRILIYKNNKEKYERWMYIQEYDGKIHTQDDIVEILTKEQYKANCYTVERNE